jgi:hypothetical protein
MTDSAMAQVWRKLKRLMNHKRHVAQLDGPCGEDVEWFDSFLYHFRFNTFPTVPIIKLLVLILFNPQVPVYFPSKDFNGNKILYRYWYFRYVLFMDNHGSHIYDPKVLADMTANHVRKIMLIFVAMFLVL